MPDHGNECQTGLSDAPTIVPGRIVLDADDLFQGQRQIIIRFDDQDYTLRITSNGKLILTK